MLKLIPVIEFEPSQFKNQDVPGPNTTRDNDPSGWMNYWKASLADSGIFDLEPFESSWMVTVSQITEPEIILKLLKIVFEDVSSVEAVEEVPSFSGGYILQSGGQTIMPQCCGSLADIENWIVAANWRSEKWTDIWIGHPWIYVRFDGLNLEVTHPSEDINESNTIIVRPKELQEAIRKAMETIQQFRKRIEPLLQKATSSELANKLLDILLFGKYPVEMEEDKDANE